MELTEAEINDLSAVYAQMQANFILDEIRDYDDATSVFGNEKYTIYHISVADKKVGFMCVWELSQFTFLEHFVIYGQFRGRGYGGEALELLKKRCSILVLECEPPESPSQQRRWEFYKRHGMIENKRDYWQPSYRENGERCYLRLLSSAKLSSFDDAVREIYREVYRTDYE